MAGTTRLELATSAVTVSNGVGGHFLIPQGTGCHFLSSPYCTQISDQWSGRWESNPVNQHYDGPLLTSKYWDSNNWAPPTRCAKARSGTVPSHDDNGFIIEWLYASAKRMECRCQSCAERFGRVAVNRPRNIHKAV